jgi:hypothetical protein
MRMVSYMNLCLVLFRGRHGSGDDRFGNRCLPLSSAANLARRFREQTMRAIIRESIRCRRPVLPTTKSPSSFFPQGKWFYRRSDVTSANFRNVCRSGGMRLPTFGLSGSDGLEDRPFGEVCDLGSYASHDR